MARLPSLTGLRAFEVSARLGSFTLAATELHVTQAAISRSIKALEEQLGYSLFARKGNRLDVTPDGKSLLPDATLAFSSLAAAIARIETSRRAPVLTVGVGPTFAIRWLIPRLARFAELAPEVEVRTTTSGPRASLIADWTCSVRLGKEEQAGVVCEPLFSARIVPVCSPTIAARLREPRDLYRVPLLDAAPTPDDWDLWLRESALDPVRVAKRQSFPMSAFALQAAIDGLGVAIGAQPYVIDDLEAGRLVTPFPLEVSKSDGWHLVYRTEALDNPAFARFRRWLKKEARAQPRRTGES